MGYSRQSKGYKLWDVQSKKFVVSRDVHFVEEPEEGTTQGESAQAATTSGVAVNTPDDHYDIESSSEDVNDIV